MIIITLCCSSVDGYDEEGLLFNDALDLGSEGQTPLDLGSEGQTPLDLGSEGQIPYHFMKLGAYFSSRGCPSYVGCKACFFRKDR